MRLLRVISVVSCFAFLVSSTLAQERRSGEDFGGIAFKIAPPFSNE